MSIKDKLKSVNIKSKPVRIAIICVILVLAVIAIPISCSKNKNKNKEQEVSIQTSLVTRGNVQSTISGSGALEPYERYEVIPLVNGEIISAPFEVGDYVEEGAVVFAFDTTDAELNLKKQRNSMQKSTITYNESLDQKDDLIIKAPCSGVVQEMSIKVGDELNAGKQITELINNQDLKVKVPFNKAQIVNIKEGDEATLTSSVAMSSITGTVTNVSSTPEAGADGASLYYVTIKFYNPGAVLEGDVFSASVNGITSPGFGKVSITESANVSASVAGKVAGIYCKEGDYVKEGDVLVKLTSQKIENSLTRSRIEYEDAKLSLENQENTLEDYRVTAPISGTVLVKNSKAGDTIDRTNSSVTMMVIGDVSKLKFTLSVDELDISKVKIGQKVNITADAVPKKTFVGEITNISMEGTATNGVTTYEAQVTINNPQELKASMNVDAVVVIESAENVLRVPSSDVTTIMGRSYVFVKDDGTKTKKDDKKSEKNDKEEAVKPEMSENTMPTRPEMGENTMPTRPEMTDKTGQTNQETNNKVEPKIEDVKSAAKDSKNSFPARTPEAPEGFIAVEVIIGVQGDDFTEIISGLSEGQEIYRKQTVSSGGSMNFGAMAGRMTGGMAGGMGGGMPARSMGNMGGSMGGMRR